VGSVLEKRHGKVRLIEIEGDPKLIIVKTTNEVAPLLRGKKGELLIGGKRISSVLTSGAVGKLKRRRGGAQVHGKVPK
jgi:hypothetical protein